MYEGCKETFTVYVLSGLFPGYGVVAQADKYDAQRIALERLLQAQEMKLDRLCADAKSAGFNIEKIARNLGTRTPGQLREMLKTCVPNHLNSIV